MNKTLISELEDAIRKQQARPASDTDSWPEDRKAWINLAAWIMIVVEDGDNDAAETQKDPGTASGS